MTLNGPTCILGVGPRGGAIVLKSTRRLGAKCVLTRRRGLISRKRFFRDGRLAMHVHCHDGPVPYSIGHLRSNHLLMRFRARTSTVTPKRSTMFCVNQEMINNSFVTSRENVKVFLWFLVCGLWFVVIGELLLLSAFILLTTKTSTRRSALGCHVDLGSGTTAACSLRRPRTFLSRGTVTHQRGRGLPVSSASLPIYHGCISRVHRRNMGIMIANG